MVEKSSLFGLYRTPKALTAVGPLGKKGVSIDFHFASIALGNLPWRRV